MRKADIIIVGGGASGLMAAVAAAEFRTKNVSILLLEHKNSVGKKILATGNGRCNFANDIIDGMSYRGNAPSFAYDIIERYDKEWLLSILKSLGIIHTSINGYYYPHSLQASTVVDSFAARLSSAGVQIKCSVDVKEIRCKNDGYIVITSDGDYFTKKLIVSTGGRSYPTLGSDGTGYKLLKKLGHNVIETYPALTGLTAKGIDFKTCHGVRAKGRLELIIDGEKTVSSQGEIQFADYGISGIPVFEISRYAVVALGMKKTVSVVVDLLTEYSMPELVEQMIGITEANPYKSIVELINAYVPYKLSKAVKILLENNVSANKNKADKKYIAKKANADTYIDRKYIERICSLLKHLPLTITGTLDYDRAQVTAGGIDTLEVDSDTMESRLHSGLYITGELLDIDGNCGGYNLHFAFATGYIAGMSGVHSLADN